MSDVKIRGRSTAEDNRKRFGSVYVTYIIAGDRHEYIMYNNIINYIILDSRKTIARDSNSPKLLFLVHDQKSIL